MCLYFSTADVDYDNLTALIVTFNIGEISRVISVTITDDGVAEDNESFEVFLKPIPDTTDVIIGEPSVAVGIIVDNDTTSKTIWNLMSTIQYAHLLISHVHSCLCVKLYYCI